MAEHSIAASAIMPPVKKGKFMELTKIAGLRAEGVAPASIPTLSLGAFFTGCVSTCVQESRTHTAAL
jgi:hypothetical protein